MNGPPQTSKAVPTATPNERGDGLLMNRPRFNTGSKQGAIDLNMPRLPEHECSQEDPKDTIAVSSAIMAFARKSIMLNASASPGPLFRKLASDRTMPTIPRQSSDIHKDEATRSGVLDSTTRTALPGEETGVSHSVLGSGGSSEKDDFSQPPKSISQQRPMILDNIASLKNTQCCQQHSDSTSLAHHKEQLTDSATVSTDSGPLIPFDLRSALRQDSERIQYRLPSLTASLSPPTSPARRSSPYAVPLARERELLRSHRVKLPSFKARPLNPKVFTSAGDLGVPRIPKKPLTVPVSPIFSKMRARSRAGNGLTKDKDSATMKLNTTGRQSTIPVADYNPHQRPQTDQSMSGAVEGLVLRPFDTKRHITTQLRAISGPPQRQSVSSEPVSSADSTMSTNRAGLNVITQEKEKHHGILRRGTMLRRPSTRPIPFRFATTELQRRRVAAATFTTTPVASSDALTLEDLV